MSVATSSTPTNPRWLFGPISDLLLGCGVAYMAIFCVMMVASAWFEATVPIWTFLLISLVISAPHYGATLLRVYERREDRRAYAIFTIHISAVLAGLFVASLYNPLLGSLLFTLYLTWSPWHYSGQNYGLALMFLRRRGIEVAPGAKRLLYASFLLSYGIVFVAFHTGSGSAGYGPALPQAESYAFVPMGIPAAWSGPLYAVLGAAYLATVGGALWQIGRGARLRDLTPALLLLASQALWFAAPGLARASNTFQNVAPLSIQAAPYVGFWIAIAHAVQYLWITTYYAARDESLGGRTRYLTKALLAGSAIWGVPALLFSPSLLGNVPYNMGLFMMVAATVNLHHFILDGAIWKLRNPRIAQVLLRSDDAGAPAPDAPGRSFTGPLVWAAGLACLVIFVFGDVEGQYGVTRAAERGDLARLELAAERLARIGRDNPKLHHQMALLAKAEGDFERAEAELKEALSIYETKNAWHNLGVLYREQGRNAEALVAYEQALAIDPSLVMTLVQASEAALALGERDQALTYLEDAARLAPRDPTLRRRIARVNALRSNANERLP